MCYAMQENSTICDEIHKQRQPVEWGVEIQAYLPKMIYMECTEFALWFYFILK